MGVLLTLHAVGAALTLAGWSLMPSWRRPHFGEAALRAAVWEAVLVLGLMGAGSRRGRR